jgi:hypothetical protein
MDWTIPRIAANAGRWMGGDVYAARLRESRAAVAELIDADKEYDAAFRDWERATSDDPRKLSDERWRAIADRYEAAIMRRIAALARCGGAQ